MPCFDRVIDKLMLDLAESPEQRAYAEGWVQGRRFAHRQACLSLCAVAVLLLLLVAAWYVQQ